MTEICEKVFRSKAGKTVIVRVFFTPGVKVEVTGDFFGSEEDLEDLERDLAQLRLSEVKILGLDNQEVLQKVKECILSHT
ncbi:hypothetical protein GWK48_01125 [Metallosphaera tengchongensis]|uniref:Lipoate--protein ligase n=1 Tax=Metallosphaera tengchongensis TaxID=1532350 RepID=A0A6N0NVL3_9CREN|nr:hypothetical protein [Metallosphaera tengchongensis]QKQ99180.1 hypothetical protein GWK48_01125 [Metallosphaera tengchongensis]